MGLNFKLNTGADCEGAEKFSKEFDAVTYETHRFVAAALRCHVWSVLIL